ncbi:MAG: PA2817 family protein [Parahaliea sp.]
MNDEQYLQHCMAIWRDFAATFVQRTATLEATDPLRELAVTCQQAGEDASQLYDQAPALMSRLFTSFPDFAPTVPRELLWFLGGECLHYLSDGEITACQQQLEEERSAAVRSEVIDLAAARARLPGPG